MGRGTDLLPGEACSGCPTEDNPWRQLGESFEKSSKSSTERFRVSKIKEPSRMKASG